MYVLSYLNNLSSKLVLSTSKKKSIGVSIGFLKVSLNNRSSSAGILKQQVFGSYDRATILRCKYDENVSTKVVKIIQSYVGVVNKMVWRKYYDWNSFFYFCKNVIQLYSKTSRELHKICIFATNT